MLAMFEIHLVDGNGHREPLARTLPYRWATVEMRQLMAFVAVADTLHFGRAADQLGIAQPAVSQLIRRLEDQLAVTLFERTSHRVSITPAGHELLPDARAAVATVQRLGDRASQLAEGSVATLRVATTEGIAAQLADLLRRYRHDHPAVALDLQVLPTTAKLANVAAGTLDVAFVRSTPSDTPGVVRRVAWSEPYVAVVPDAHPAAAVDRLDVEAVRSLPLMIIPRAEHTVMHDELLDVCRSMDLEPRVRPTLATPQETFAMIATGAAWTLFVEGNVPPLPGVAICALPEHTPPSRVWVIWRPVGAPKHVLQFVDAATAENDSARESAT
jgi:DNA-binding transcriptional LysR family regulator